MVDTAGSMEFPAMRELRIRSATAIIIVYNVAESNSIMMASALKKQVQQMRGGHIAYFIQTIIFATDINVISSISDYSEANDDIKSCLGNQCYMI